MADVFNVALKITLVIFMIGNLLSMGLRLRLAEAWAGLRNFRFVTFSLLWGFVICPVVAWLLARSIPMAQPYAVGMVLLGMTPCAPFLPPMVERARGDLGYTAAFMLLMSVVTIIYMPLVVPFMVEGLSASAWTIAKPLLLLVLGPLAIGLAIQRWSETFAAKLHPPVKKITGIDTIFMLILCVLIYGKEFVGMIGSYAIGTQILFFSFATIAPFFLSFGLSREQRSVVALGMATRNLGAAFAPLFAVTGFDQRAIVMVAMGAVMQTTFSFAAATWFGRRTRGGEKKEIQSTAALKTQTH